MENHEPWVGTWTTAPAPLEGIAFNNQTLRMILRVSRGGRLVRVRFSNAFGTRPLTIGHARIALRDTGAAVLAASDRPLAFGGASGVTVAAGAIALSDPVPLDVPSLCDLAVSFHLPGDIPETFGITGHKTTRQTSYISPSGDFTGAPGIPAARKTESWYFLSCVEIAAPAGAHGIVALGDSLTDANLSTPDTNNRWPDQLARRLFEKFGPAMPGVMNQGIGGNRILHDLAAESGLRRFDRDVLAQPGATHVVVLLGINDIRNRRGRPEEIVAAHDIVAGLQQLARRARAKGLKIFGATILPFENETFVPGCYTEAGEAKRQAVNAWIRTGNAFDAVVDFDAALRDPSAPARLRALYDCGDHLHLSDAGYRAMGDTAAVALFG